MKTINGILMIYHHVLAPNASTIMEHVNAFEKYSQFKVWNVNTELGFFRALNDIRFKIIVLHYSLFAWLPFRLNRQFFDYIQRCRDSYKIAFFQDEYRFWPERSELLSALSVDAVFTLLEQPYFEKTYGKYTRAPKLIYTLPAYVSSELTQMGRKHYKPVKERTVDVGYRGRQPAYYLGRGAQEKQLIAVEFKKRASHLGLTLDIETEETKRIYGDHWIRFLANCKAVLGVEAGTSIFDIDNSIRPKYAELCAGNPELTFPDISFEEVYDRLLGGHEDRIYYRTISARHFEAAALFLCQILFEGKYSGILKPMVHYIPLKKDFSNFDEVIELFENRQVHRDLTKNSYRDLIASGKYSYKRLAESIDNLLLEAGLSSDVDASDITLVNQVLKKDALRRHFVTWLARLRRKQFPGRGVLKQVVKPVLPRTNI